jgi:hypothetical protein
MSSSVISLAILDMKTQETTTVKETQQLASEGATFMKPPGFALTAASANAKSGVEDPEQEANTVVLTSGQMTRLGEAKPKFIYWPDSPSSGVTLGVGYDIGGRDRASVVADLTAHGMAVEQANKIAAGAGLKGDAAKQFVIANKKAIGPIPDAVAESLFRDTMASKRKEAKALATGKKASQNDAGDYVNARGREIHDQVPEGTYVMTGEQWDRLHPAMLEFLTDLKYQGAYYAYDRIAKVNAILIAHEGDDLAQFKGVATLFESDDDGEISYMDKYNDSLLKGEQSKNQEVFFGQSKAEMSRSWRRRNRVRYAFLLQVIKALESGKAVSMSDQPSLPRPAASPVAKAPAFAKGDQLLGSTETKGASLETAKAIDPTTTESGVSSSEKLVKADLEAIAPMSELFKEIGNGHGLPPALLAAIASRETGVGKLLDGNDCGPDGKRSGVMGVDDQAHPSPRNEDRKANIARAAAILAGLREEVKAKFPSWTAADQLLGAVTAYHQPQGFVATWDGKPIAGDDYASDIWARARHLAGLKMFSGLDPIPVVVAKEPSKDSPSGKRPALKTGKLIAQSVGRGGVNHPDDVRAVLDRLNQLDVISQVEAQDTSPEAVAAFIERYQALISDHKPDGLIEPGRGTENKLIEGVTTKVAKAESKTKPEKGGKEPMPTPKTEPKPKSEPSPEGEPDYEAIATQVYAAMFEGALWGLGTDRETIIASLKQLQQKAAYIDKFKAVYTAKYGSDVSEDVDSEVDNWFLFIPTGELDEIMIWLQPLGVKRSGKPKAGGKPGAEGDNTPEGWDFSETELDVKEYWQTQKGPKCDIYTKKVIDGHKADHPELYKDLGDIGESRTTEDNSLHLVWEKDHEQGKNRVEGPRNANDIDTLVKDECEWDMAIRYMIACLKIGVPVMVGVNHTFAYKNASANPDKTTDHWLTVIGKGEDEKGKYFSYTDPGTKNQNFGTNTENNRLYQTKDPHIWRDETKYAYADAGSGSYTLVAVSLYDKHRGKKEFKVGTEVFKRK